MWHDVRSYLNQSKIRKSKIDKSDLLDTIGPLESVCDGRISLEIPSFYSEIFFFKNIKIG